MRIGQRIHPRSSPSRSPPGALPAPSRSRPNPAPSAPPETAPDAAADLVQARTATTKSEGACSQILRPPRSTFYTFIDRLCGLVSRQASAGSANSVPAHSAPGRHDLSIRRETTAARQGRFPAAVLATREVSHALFPGLVFVKPRGSALHNSFHHMRPSLTPLGAGNGAGYLGASQPLFLDAQQPQARGIRKEGGLARCALLSNMCDTCPYVYVPVVT